MSPAPKSHSSTSALSETASSTLSLLRSFTTLLSAPTSSLPPTNLPSDAPNPLNVLHDAATLLKAHVTKLSLLMINTPFTPSEIKKIISNGIASTCAPAMMSAVEICREEKFGRMMHEEVKGRVRKVFVELESMMSEVLAQVQLQSQSGGADAEKSGRGSLVSTGVVWEACDALMELKGLGVAGLAVRRAQMYRETLEDALFELREWAEGIHEKGEEEDDGTDEEDVEGSGSDMFYPQGSIPKDRVDLRETLDTSLKRLKLVSTLYQALVKRRLKTVGSGMDVLLNPGYLQKIDRIIDTMKRIPDDTDELAGAFYELDDQEAKRRTEEICKSGKELVDLARRDWGDAEDEFTGWTEKWIAAVDR